MCRADVKLIYFHPLLQEIEELFHFPIKAYQHIRSVPHGQGQDWATSYELGTIRITDNDVKDSITARSYDLRQDRTIDGTSVLLRGYPEVETLCDNSYQNNNSYTYKSVELRFLRNGKTHYNEKLKKLYGEKVEVCFN